MRPVFRALALRLSRVTIFALLGLTEKIGQLEIALIKTRPRPPEDALARTRVVNGLTVTVRTQGS